MRRIIFFCMSILFTVCTLAYDFEIDGLGYTILSTSDCELGSVIRGADKITIPEKVTYLNKELKVIGIANSAFYNCSTLQKIEMPTTIKYIGSYAFANCYALQEFTFPSSISIIADNVLAGCTDLHKVIIPNSVTEIGTSAFANCSNMENIKLPNQLKRFGDNVFCDCSSMSEIRIPQSVSAFGSSVFSRCNSLQDVYVEWLTPPYLYNQIFDVTTNGFIIKTLHVPNGTENKYLNSFPWTNFWDIQGYVVPSNLVGDANGDFTVDVADITTVSSYILGNAPDNFAEDNADTNFDGTIDIADITTIASIILTKPDPQGDGSVNNPYNVADLDSLFENDVIPTEKIYARGIVSQINDIDTSYGYATYFISDDGKTTNHFEIYRGYGLGGEKFKTGDEFQVGDTLVVYGQVVLYGSTREFTTGSSIYSINAGQDIPPTPVCVKTLPYQSSNLYNDWSTQFLVGANNPWIQGNTHTLATGYQKWDGSDTKSNKEVEGYLVSPAISTKTDSSSVSFSFDYTIRYENNVPGWEKYHKIYATTNPYDANSFVEVTWAPKASTTMDWTLYTSGNIALPSQFVNKDSVYIMFYFYAPLTASTTWELENFSIFAGSGTSPKPDPKPVGDNLIANGDFETWNGSDATYWKSTTTVSTSGAVSQSTDAHTGTYAAKLGGNGSKNQRIAYKEITLQPGTYNIKFYAKSTGEKSSINPGYAYNSGSSMTYVYTDYVDVTGTWTEVSKTITLAAQTTINLVIMNSKNPGTDVLIDDYSLTTSDGGIVDGGTPDPTPQQEETKIATVKEFLDAPESTNVWYELTGEITNLKDGDLYGNFDLVDTTGSVYVYGVLSEKGGAKKLFQDLVSKYGLKDGVKITIRGNRGSYNGRIEVDNAYFVSTN